MENKDLFFSRRCDIHISAVIPVYISYSKILLSEFFIQIKYFCMIRMGRGQQRYSE